MTDSSSQEILGLIERAAPIVRASQYMTLSGFAFLLYDYLLTVHQEIELIWKAPKSHISYMFLGNRYIVPLMLAVDIYDRLGLANPPSHLFCNVWVWIEAYLTVISFMSLHGLVAMRVHALFGGGKKVKWILWTAWVIYVIVTFVLLSIGLSHGQPTLTVEPYFNTCYEELSPMLWTVWLPSLILESILFFLTILKAIREAKMDVYHPISSILYRDGILYYLAFTVATLYCMFVWMLGTSEYEGLAKYWATAVVNVAGSRLVLSLKANAQAFRSSRLRTRVPVGQSSSFVVGSMWTFSDPEFCDHGYRDSEDYLIHCGDPRLYELPQLGTIYPDETQTHWEAI